MPKLASKMQKDVKKAEAAKPSGNFELIPRGKYVARLSAVTEEDSDYGVRWVAEFSDIMSTSGAKFPGRQWFNIPMPQDVSAVPDDYEPKPRRGEKKTKAEAWASLQEYRVATLKAFFDAMGYTEETDTDEMVDDEAKALITITINTAKSGARKGDRFNNVGGLEPIPEGLEIPDAESADEDDEGF